RRGTTTGGLKATLDLGPARGQGRFERRDKQLAIESRSTQRASREGQLSSERFQVDDIAVPSDICHLIPSGRGRFRRGPAFECARMTYVTPGGDVIGRVVAGRPH